MLSPVPVREMRRIDKEAIQMGLPVELMMENAGKALAFHLKNHFKDLHNKRIVCIAGKGNNGGGAIASIRHILYYGANTISLILLCQRKAITAPSHFHLSLLKNLSIRTIIYDSRASEKALLAIREADIIVDGIFGIGFSGIVREPILSIIEEINNSSAYVLSNDLP